ncbi:MULTISPECIES: helix-hairpin-helix domain-containing protein [unclassified Clostridium]|uniref:helix-hairpin-helix domain-containing protein n=1 Tax=unclassified Clostridium TaxID=2614128 RepID=UPI000297D72F|nr:MULTISPECIES: helix-hairpin-helix domain-containing protein [unclassified Clostridium]EKQ55129.1 MAG: competence protein ComEA-like protein with helix-hairpin-helix repeat region [Clostridium sp. Maddingley MBC34-26]
MVQEFLKDKKKVGIFAILAIMLIAAGVLYFKSGYKELKKNETESIFVDNTGDTDKSVNKNGDAAKNKDSTDNKKTNIELKDKNIVVEIKGEVKKPDVYILNEDSIIKDLIEQAGGLTENADVSNINRAKKLQNHELIYIANKNEKAVESQSSEPNTTNTNLNSQNNINKKVNINSATLEELKTLNGIGDSKAESIIEYREKNGNFKSIEEIKNVNGIGEKMFEKIKEYIET